MEINYEFRAGLKDNLVRLVKSRGKEDSELEFLGCGIAASGYIDELCTLLNTSKASGLVTSERNVAYRVQVFGSNEIPRKKSKTFFILIGEALKDVTLVILMIAALVSLLLSLYQPDANMAMESKGNWIEAIAILGTVMTVALVTAANNYQKEQQFRGLQATIESDQSFSVIRNGVIQIIPIKDILVGDICVIQYGNVIPADGILVQSNELKIDESSITGESNLVNKTTNIAESILLSGTKVMEGNGHMMVLAVGLNSQTGRICSLLGLTPATSRSRKIPFWNAHRRSRIPSQHGEETLLENGLDVEPPSKYLDLGRNKSPMQIKLAKLSIKIGYIGVSAAVVTVLILTARFCMKTFWILGGTWQNSYINVFVRFIILGVTVIVVSVPEGLPLAVTLALAYSVRQMMHDNNLVRHLDACETMGNATTICCDKTGTLTTNQMSVVDCFIAGIKISITTDAKSVLNIDVARLVCDAISANSAKSSIVEPSFDGSLSNYVGNRTECALLSFIFRIYEPVRNEENAIEKIRRQFPESLLVKLYPFDSKRKSMSSAYRIHSGCIRLFVKGASEVVLNKCRFQLSENSMNIAEFDEKARNDVLRNVIENMARAKLRTICVAYRDFYCHENEIDWKNEASIVSDLTFIGIFGIADPVRNEVPDAIKTCQRAGVVVRMVTGDNIETARAIATECGILNCDDDLIVEGMKFNSMIRNPLTHDIDPDRLDNIWPRLRVLARSSPEDKYNLVSRIMTSKVNKTGEIVAVTGDGTNDAPALHVADVGFAMGIAGTDVAKEASDIILIDDNFASLVKALIWGRNVYDSIAKFIQFQLTVNIVACLIAVISATIIEDAVVNAIQMLYVNLLMDTMASLALSTEPPSSRLVDRPPYGRSRPLVSATMAKNIILNSFYQLLVLLLLAFWGENILSVDSGRGLHHISDTSSTEPTQHFTAIFNAFVLMTMCNEICARRLNNERNPFRGLHKSKTFLAIWFASLVSQVLVIQFGGMVFRTAPLCLDHWVWCIFFGIGQLLWAQVVASIPLEKTVCFGKLFGSPLKKGL